MCYALKFSINNTNDPSEHDESPNNKQHNSPIIITNKYFRKYIKYKSKYVFLSSFRKTHNIT